MKSPSVKCRSELSFLIQSASTIQNSTMKFITNLFLCLITATSVLAAPYNDTETDARRKFVVLDERYKSSVQATVNSQKTGCTSKNIIYRREWGTLSKAQRAEYITAVKCLQSKAPRSDKSVAAGVRSRYDDFVLNHMQLTPKVHFSGLFLPFHRYFVWNYENALREECGYKGAQPYWDWTLSWEDPSKSTVFDGSPYSMGSNGAVVPHNGTTVSVLGLTFTIPPGTGGGCITSGPFSASEYNVTLGPIAFKPYGPDNGYGYNPRCLTRDLAPLFSNNTRPSSVVSLLEPCTDIQCFNTLMEAPSGVHAGGHLTVGGMELDTYASVVDPIFWLHHASIDRMWAIWQGQNSANRTNQVFGTQTAFNTPPSANVTLSTTIDFGVLASPQKVGDILNPLSGPFCYSYV